MKVNESALVPLWVITWNSVSTQASVGIPRKTLSTEKTTQTLHVKNETKKKKVWGPVKYVKGRACMNPIHTSDRETDRQKRDI